MPTEKYAHAARSSSTAQRIGHVYGLYDRALFQTEVTDLEWDEASSAGGSCGPTGTTSSRAQFVAIGDGPAARREAAGHPRHRDVRGPRVPHQPLGLRLHRWRHRPARRWTASPTSGWRSSAPARPRPVRAASSASTPQELLRLPADAVVGRRARQPADRPGLVRRRRHARLAAALADNFVANMIGRRVPSRGPGQRRLDRHLAKRIRGSCRRRARARPSSRTCWTTSRSPTSRR